MRNGRTTIEITEFPYETDSVGTDVALRSGIPKDRDVSSSKIAQVKGGFIEFKSNGKIDVHRVESNGTSPLNSLSDISIFELVWRVLGGLTHEVKQNSAYRDMADYVTDNAEKFARHDSIRVTRWERKNVEVIREVDTFGREPIFDFLENNLLDFPEYEDRTYGFVEYATGELNSRIDKDEVIQKGLDEMVAEELKPTLLNNHFEDVVSISKEGHIFWEAWTGEVYTRGNDELRKMNLMDEFCDYLSGRAEPLDFSRYHVLPCGSHYVLADLGNLQATKEFDSEEEAIARGEELAVKKDAALIRNSKVDGKWDATILMEK